MRLLADTDITRRRYESILAESESASVYQTIPWLCALKSLSAELIFVEVSKETLVPFVCKGRGPLRRAYSLPYDTYGGPIAPISRTPVSFEGVARGLGMPSVRVVDFSANVRSTNGAAEHATTHIVELAENYTHVARRYSGANKRVIRQAAERGVRISVMSDHAQLRLFYRLYRRTMRRYACRLLPFDFFTAVYQLMVPKGLARFYLAWHGGVAVAGNLVLRLDGHACDWMWVYNEKHGRLRPTNALIDRAIRDEVERGAKKFNLGASPSDQPGSIRFKRGFGATEYRYNIFSHTGFCYETARLLREYAGRVTAKLMSL